MEFVTAEDVEMGLCTGKLETVTFGMGCFWAPDSRIGAIDGVVQTRVGYAGGTMSEPVYRNMTGHAEVVRVVYDPSVLPFASLFETFRNWLTPAKAFGSKYRPVVITTTHAQAALVGDFVESIAEVSVRPQFVKSGDEARFWPAEDYHQKYRLKKASPGIIAALIEKFGDRWDESPMATKLNGIDPDELAARTDELLAELSGPRPQSGSSQDRGAAHGA